MKIYVTDLSGKRHELEGLEGWRVMEVIRDWDLPIKAECGGCCSCATCHIYVSEDWLDKLPKQTEEEIDRLDEAFDIEDNSRLSCQIILTKELDGLELTLSSSSDISN